MKQLDHFCDVKYIFNFQVDSGNNISLPAGLSLNSAVTIIPTSPHKVPNNVSKKVSNVSNKVPTEVNYTIIIYYIPNYLKKLFTDKLEAMFTMKTR